MIDSKDILTLLSIPSEDVLTSEIIKDSEETTFVEIELKDNRPSCPFCFSNSIGIKGYYNVKIKNNIIRKHNLFVSIRMRRYKCKNCLKTFKQPYSFYEDKSHISLKIKEIVKHMLLEPISMQYIAKEIGITRQTVLNILDQIPDAQRLRLPEVLCIDEFHFSNANNKAGKFPCVLSNPFKTEIIDIIESRRKPYLQRYFSSIPFKERNNVKFFISDMNDTYRYVHNTYFKNSVHIVDHFHIVKLFTEAIQTIRIRIMKNNDKNAKAYNFLKKHWKLFLMNRYDLERLTFTNEKTGIVYNYVDKVDMVLREYPELAKVYYAKDLFSNKMLKLHEFEETKVAIDYFIKYFDSSNVYELIKIAKTFLNWYIEIINAYSKNSYGVVLTNAIAESNNNYIQKLINIGYGYTNFSHLRKRVLYMSSNRKND